jgi:ABC-type nickel/cobalt efflux system permease component RcnA
MQDDLPTDVEEIPVRPVWQLSDKEERRTRKIEVDFRGPGSAVAVEAEREAEEAPGGSQPSMPPPSTSRNLTSRRPEYTEGLSRLLDRGSGVSWLAVLLIAAGLGAVHAIQPGHGKTLVAAIAVGTGTRWYQPALLGLVTTLSHTGSVLLIAAILWWTGASQVAGLHRWLTRLAGFAIAAGGLYRLGRQLGGWGEHPMDDDSHPVDLSPAGLLGLGVAGGMVPCWDAVGLVVLSTALGRLGSGVLLVIAFGLGMAAVLVGVGLLAVQLKSRIMHSSRVRTWEAPLALGSGLVLASIGLVFFLG